MTTLENCIILYLRTKIYYLAICVSCISNFSKWPHQHQHVFLIEYANCWYSNQMSLKLQIWLSTILKRKNYWNTCQIFKVRRVILTFLTRLSIGHTQLTHNHAFKSQSYSLCQGFFFRVFQCSTLTCPRHAHIPATFPSLLSLTMSRLKTSSCSTLEETSVYLTAYNFLHIVKFLVRWY